MGICQDLEMKLQDKTVIVTGGTRGIGRAISKAFAMEGANLVLNYYQNKAAAEETVKAIRNLERRVIAVKGDISIILDVEYLLTKTLEIFGRVDVLINNAGVNKEEDIFKISEEMWTRIIDVNLKGVFICSKVFGEYMLHDKSGCIVNIASIAGIQPLPRSHHYVASKSGVIGLTKSLAGSFAPYVRVNCVAPGYVETERWKTRTSVEQKEIIKMIPLNRPAKPLEIAKTVIFLTSDGTYITGQTVVIDGGLTLR
jgi:3-oxoacyl-[acyl-carrier protein] reductase